MNRNEYEVAVRQSGLDPISRAMLMAAASYRKWKAGEEVEPFLSVAILVDATGFKSSAVAPRYRLLKENGWLIATGQKTHKQASYYSLAIGEPFKVSTTRTTYKVTVEEVVHDTDNQLSATRTAGCPSDGQEGVRQTVTENGERMDKENVVRLEVTTPPAAGGDELSLNIELEDKTQTLDFELIESLVLNKKKFKRKVTQDAWDTVLRYATDPDWCPSLREPERVDFAMKRAGVR